MSGAVALTVRYAVTRGEVWRYYWRAWRRKLWKIHLAYFLLFALMFSFAVFGRLPDNPLKYLTVLLAGLAPIGAFILIPQIMFKPENRTLTASKDGISTTIGRKVSEVAWRDVSAIRAENAALAVEGETGRAFIIPERAFNSLEEREAFAEFVRRSWLDAK